VPRAWAIGYVAVFGVFLLSISWSFGDTVALMQKAARLTWRESVVDAFTRGLEYRPLFNLAIKLSYETVGAQIWFYRALVLIQFALVLGFVVWLCRPLGARRAIAACIAISCLCGLHSTRILFGFWPLNHYGWVLVLLLGAIALAFRPVTRSIDWVLGLVTLAALFALELGLLIVPILVVLWLARAPGLSARAVVSVLIAAGLYLTIRLTFTSELAVNTSVNGNGFGFSMLNAEGVRSAFGDPPWLLWIYDVMATGLTVVLSEPRDGVYSFVESLLAHDMESWRWFHVGLSTLTSAVIVVGLVLRSSRGVRLQPDAGQSRGFRLLDLRSFSGGGQAEVGRDRLLIVVGLTLMLFGSGLGFLYTRDRIALSVGVGYALLLYVALAGLMERMPAAGWRRRLAAGGLVVLAAAWVVRSGETLLQLRDTAWDYHLEWTTRLDEKSGATERTDLFKTLHDDSLRTTPADPRLDPAWTYTLFERRFTRSSEDQR
jgi:hypothetical protein